MRKIRITFTYIVAIVWLLFTFVPFYFLVISSLKTQTDFLINPLGLPTSMELSNYAKAWDNIKVYMKNSLIVVIPSVFLTLLLASMAAYAFSRFKFKGKELLFALFLGGMSIPFHTTLIPIYIITRNIGLYDNLLSLIGPYITSNLPISIFILTSFMEKIPKELEESARIDGCKSWNIFLRIILPLSRPGIVTVGIYDAIMCWNELVYALVLLSSPQNKTLPMGLWDFQGRWTVNIPMTATAVVISIVPILIFYILFRGKIIEGMVAGALKG